MREYLFRGKHSQIDEWLIGFYYEDRYKNPKILIDDPIIGLRECYVIPETVGQYVGINDDNAVKIFEKDIVKVSYRIRDEDGNYIKKQENRLVSLEPSSFGLMSIFGEWTMGYMCEPITVEVIGNVIDNEGLLNDSK